MAVVVLEFTAPVEEGVVALRVYESDQVDGAYDQIVRTTDIGDYPGYITSLTVENATSAGDWFTIAWEYENGALGDSSNPIQGGSATIISRLISRVMLRNPDLDENVVRQESEGVIEKVLHTDPYLPNIAVSYSVLNGMVLLVLARMQLSHLASTVEGSDSFTAGLVSYKPSTSTPKLADVKALLDEASRMLGFSTARIVQMCVPEIAGGLSQVVMADISRLEIDVA